MLDVYAEVCRDMLALPVVKGIKSPSERFAGADETYTIEALMQNGWALQVCTHRVKVVERSVPSSKVLFRQSHRMDWLLRFLCRGTSAWTMVS